MLRQNRDKLATPLATDLRRDWRHLYANVYAMRQGRADAFWVMAGCDTSCDAQPMKPFS
jgi:hypothetical protein